VPDVLLSGNHQSIKDWKKEKKIEITKDRRPDLWRKYKKLND
jgi:tRNA (guanine37-N1)-methyltransferase